ncbi:MAG: hypothetical protein AAGG07_04815 [Planctomycetota bacterium]
MPSSSGRVSFGRLGVTLPAAEMITSEHLERLGQWILSPTPGVAPSELEAGWTGGEHVLDQDFNHEKNLFDGGSMARFGLRLDTNRVPSEMKKAIKGQHERALLADGETGFLSRREKRELKDLVERALHDELASGKHRSSKMVPVLWDASRRVMLSAASGNSVIEKLCALWRETFSEDGGGALRPLSAGAIAAELLADRGETRRMEDMRPSPFTPPPGGGETERPVVPWATASPEPLDFLGNEMLFWLWHRCETTEGLAPIALADGSTADIYVALEGSLECECAWGVTGKQTLTPSPEGIVPARTPEARQALASGKWPRRAGLLLGEGERLWKFSLQADRWLVSAAQIPAPPDDGSVESPRDHLEWRFDQVRRLDELLIGLFDAFLRARASEGWTTTRQRISDWVRSKGDEKPALRDAARSVTPRSPVRVDASAATETGTESIEEPVAATTE